MTNPFVTILTPAYNRRVLLERLLDSIIRQRTPVGSFEWLVIDDGSTDGTAAYLKEISQKYPDIVRFQASENGGKHRALNRGARLARGDWVMVVDSDDWFVDDAITIVLEEIRQVERDARVGIVVGLKKFVGETTQRQFAIEINPCTSPARLPSQYPEITQENRQGNKSIAKMRHLDW